MVGHTWQCPHSRWRLRSTPSTTSRRDAGRNSRYTHRGRGYCPRRNAHPLCRYLHRIAHTDDPFEDGGSIKRLGCSALTLAGVSKTCLSVVHESHTNTMRAGAHAEAGATGVGGEVFYRCSDNQHRYSAPLWSQRDCTNTSVWAGRGYLIFLVRCHLRNTEWRTRKVHWRGLTTTLAVHYASAGIVRHYPPPRTPEG